MRLAGREAMGYYPTPVSVVERIKSFIQIPNYSVTLLDPCAGESLALNKLAEGLQATTYGIELDNYRAQEAKTRIQNVLHCGFEEARISNRAFSCLFLNPPYDFESVEKEEEISSRKEKWFLQGTIQYLQPKGLLIYIIPQYSLSRSIAKILSYRFENFRVCRFPDGEFEAFRQIVLFATRKGQNSSDEDMQAELELVPKKDLAELPFMEEPVYKLPSAIPIQLFRSSRIDPEELKKELKESALWGKFSDMANIKPLEIKRPPLPLHTGHIGLLLASGMLDGVVGEPGSLDRHIVRGVVEKITISYEEQPSDEVIEEHQLEQFRVSIKLLKQNGDIVRLV